MQQKFNLDGTEGKDDATVIRAVEQSSNTVTSPSPP